MGGLGVAFDLGTTTIAAALAELDSGRIIEARSMPNPQIRWGADVLSRVAAIKADPGLLSEMSSSAVAACNELVRGLSPEAPPAGITVAGNTVMEQILLGISPVPLASPPYRPVSKKAVRVDAQRIGLIAAPGASVYVFPLIGGFIGGDAVAVILALGLHKEREPALAVDIGTNSEIILAAGGGLYAASAAAGPAFEAGGVRDGMTAVPGAIAGVRVEGDELRLEVIGGAAPKGICGSGLIDAAAAFLDAGMIDPTGRIVGPDEAASNLGNRIKPGADGFRIVLYRAAKTEVALTQTDVRGLQTAKAAIKAGLSLLLARARITPDELKKVYLAGAFGSNIRKEALARIGLIEPALLPAVSTAGDAAMLGAAEALGSSSKKDEAQRVASVVKYVALSGSPGFEREFLRAMNF
ncbi:MAG: DUF4445 domain-containing protein [Deltaproteobacteria bacterium]|nr:DUF4445 domain-containing protein [Deltaproteobacteria bacterium]